MKHLYICDKCGATHTDVNAAYACEWSHTVAEEIYSWDLTEDTSVPMQTYVKGSKLPATVYLKMRVRDDEGNFMTNDDGSPMYTVAPFKRLAHDGICDAIEMSMRERWLADNRPANTEN